MLARIANFGGIIPALAPRALPANAGQVCHNLLASVGYFQPVHADVAVAVSAVNNPQTLYRLDRKADGAFNSAMTTGWVVAAAPVSYAKGPLNSDTTERTYYSFDDGSAPPRWLDAQGNDRILGVPVPASPPTTAIAIGDEFTAEERAAAVLSAQATMTTLLRAHLNVVWRGYTAPIATTNGYINWSGPPNGTPNQGLQARVYRLASFNGANNGAISNTYTGSDAAGFSFASDPALAPAWVLPASTWPAWAGYNATPALNPDHIAITFHAYGLTYSVDTAPLTAALAAIPMPSKTDGSKLLTAAQITNGSDGIIDRLVARLDPEKPENKQKITALSDAVGELRILLNGGAQELAKAQIAQFYATPRIATMLVNEKTAWASKVFDAALAVRRSSVADTDYGGSAGE